MNAAFDKLLPALARGGVEFILIGGMAGVIHGSGRATYDVDIVYARGAANLKRLAVALKPFKPYLRGAPAGLPFSLDVQTLRHGLNFTLTSIAGDIDLLGEAVGGGGYEYLKPQTITVEAFGAKFLCVDLPTLIKLKQAAGRPRDLEALAELQALLDGHSPPGAS